jgi:hypothetical protein
MRCLLAALLVLSACGLSEIPRVATIQCPGVVRGVSIFTDGRAPCDKLAIDVEAAFQTGVAWGAWGRDQTWGFELQAIAPSPLPAVDTGGIDGTLGRTTWGAAGDRIIVTSGLGEAAFRAILTHELIHATYGEADHCGWSRRYVEMFNEVRDPGEFYDGCYHVHCQGMAADSTEWRCQ